MRLELLVGPESRLFRSAPSQRAPRTTGDCLLTRLELLRRAETPLPGASSHRRHWRRRRRRRRRRGTVPRWLCRGLRRRLRLVPRTPATRGRLVTRTSRLAILLWPKTFIPSQLTPRAAGSGPELRLEELRCPANWLVSNANHRLRPIPIAAGGPETQLIDSDRDGRRRHRWGGCRCCNDWRCSCRRCCRRWRWRWR